MNQAHFFDSIAKDWDKIIEVDESKIKTLLSKVNIRNNQSILDVGTGTGVLVPFLKELNPNGIIKCVDISTKMIEIAKEKFKYEENLYFSILDIEQDNLYEQFDKIIIYSMFPHLQNRTLTIKKLIEHNLKENGQLIIAHSNSRGFLNNMHREKDEAVKNDRLICVKKQKDLFEDAGLNVSEAFENDEIYYLVIDKI